MIDAHFKGAKFFVDIGFYEPIEEMATKSLIII